MNEEQKRVKIAEACKVDQWMIMKRGLYYRENGAGYTSCIAEAWKLSNAEAKKHEYPYDEPVTIHPCQPPDYFHDLNAMHEAEESLTDDQRFRFACLLGEIVLATPDDPPNYDRNDYGPGSWAGMREVSRVISATASMRAEAFGKALRLW